MDAFMKDGLVPSILETVPPVQLQVRYAADFVPGCKLSPTKVKDEPSVTWEADKDAFYTIIMNDPDAPSRADPKFGEFHHWLVTNIPGNDIAKGDVMTEYIGSGAPKGTSWHRYVIVVFKQPGKVNFTGLHKISKNTAEGRRKWNLKDFAKKYNLGSPVAGTFFQAEYDDYVPTVHKQMKLAK